MDKNGRTELFFEKNGTITNDPNFNKCNEEGVIFTIPSVVAGKPSQSFELEKKVDFKSAVVYLKKEFIGHNVDDIMGKMKKESWQQQVKK